MKIKSYFVWLADTYILGPCVSLEMGEIRIGLSLIGFEVGLGIDLERVYSFGCHSCGAIDHAKMDHLPEGWEKRRRPDHTYYFLCLKCRGFEADEDYVVTDENREQAIDKIIGQLVGSGEENIDRHVQLIRGYISRLLDESGNWSKFDLSQMAAAYDDGFTDARRKEDDDR